MIIQKIYWHIQSILKITLYKLLYGKKIKIGSLTVRDRFNLTILMDGHIYIGKNVFFNHDCSITSCGSVVKIGDGTIFGENVKIYDHNHCYEDINIPIKDQGYTTAPVSIGNHCWICSNVVILKGVTIGNNVVIGAGCVIYKDIPSSSIVINKQELRIIPKKE